MRAVAIFAISLYCFGTSGSPTSSECFSIKKIAEGNAKVSSYECDDLVIEIPNQINGLKIVAIGASAFEGQKLVSVLIPDGVKVIEEKAFNQSYLERVTIPDSVEIIEGFAFWYGELTEVRLPKNLKQLGYGAFSTNNIKSVVMPNSLTKIGPAIFYRNQLETVVLSSGLTEIPEMAFLGNSLKTIVIPDQVESIGQVAFSGNKLVEAILPESLKVIRKGAFRDNLLKQISFPLNLRLIEGDAFFNNHLVKVKLPENVEVIERGAFKQNPLVRAEVPGEAYLKDAFDKEAQIKRFGQNSSGLWAKYSLERIQNSSLSELTVLHEVFLSEDQRHYILDETITNKKTGDVTRSSGVTDPRLVSLDRARESRDSCEKSNGQMGLQVVGGKEVKTCRKDQPDWVRVYAEVPFGIYLDHKIFEDESFSLSDKKQLLDFGRH